MGQGGSTKGMAGQPGCVYVRRPEPDKRSPGRCPFHGLTYATRIYTYVEMPGGASGNQCGVYSEYADEYRPCQMEQAGQVPDFENCPVPLQVVGAERLNDWLNKAIFIVGYPRPDKPQTLGFSEWWTLVKQRAKRL